MENINVYVRLKPLKEKVENNFTYDSNSITNKKTNECFSFDSIITPQTSNKEIFEKLIKNNLSSLLKGINISIFAYGQTSTGKTFTMKGDSKNEGIISLSIKEIFSNLEKSINKFTIKVSYIEIYNETVNDLLDTSKKNLEIRESIEKGLFVNNISEITVTNLEKAMNLLNKGELNKVTAETKLNEKSSRSHTIFKINIEFLDNKKKYFSQLNLVDLAGSENVSKAKCEGLRIKEGGNINKSLLALSNVISKLSQNNKTFVNYRDSKLTRLLQTSLAGNSKTTIICTIVDDNNHYSETINTLHFAIKAKNVKTTFKVNEINDKSKIAMENKFLRNKIKILEQLINDKKLNKDLILNSDIKNIKNEDDLNNNKNTEQISNLEKEVVLLKKYLMNNEEINSDINSAQGGDVMTVISGGYYNNNNHNINTSAYKIPYYNFSSLRNNSANSIKSSFFNSPYIPYNYESLNNNNLCMTEMRKTNIPKTFFHSAIRPQNFIERSNLKIPMTDLDYDNNNYLMKENEELKKNIYELKKSYYEVVQSKEQQIKLLNQNHDMTLENCEKLIKEAETNYMNLKSDYDQTLKNIEIKEAELNSLKEQTENQSSSINYYKNELNKIKDMNFTTEMETKYNSLLEENIKLKQKEEIYSKLKQENELLKNNVNEMDNKYREKCQEISKNTKIIEDSKKSLEKEIQKFKNEIKNIKNNNNIKKKSDTEIIEKIKEYEEKINKLTEENNNYKNNVENIEKTQIAEYQKLLDDSFAKILELNKELNDTKNKNEYLAKVLSIAEKTANKNYINDNFSSNQRNNNETDNNFLSKKRKLMMPKAYQNAMNKQSSTVSSKQTPNKENDKFADNAISKFEI